MPPFEPGGYLEVTGDGLAVRSGPGPEHALVSEWLLTQTVPIETTLLRDEVRLSAGHVVRVQLGPLIVDQTVWVAVDNVPQAGQADGEARVWRTVAPVPYAELDFELTWIAVAEPGATFARVTEPPACSPCYGDPPASAVAAGIGEGRVGPWSKHGVAFMTFAAAAPSSAVPCEFRVATSSGGLWHDEGLVDYFSARAPGVDPFPDAVSGESVWLDVSGDCTWAATVYLPQG